MGVHTAFLNLHFILILLIWKDFADFKRFLKDLLLYLLILGLHINKNMPLFYVY